MKKYIKFLKENVYIVDNEQQFISYFENYWNKQKIDLFNYYHLIHDVIKLTKAYINKKGSSNSEKDLISMVKSLEKVYITNNICESIHSHISNYIENKKVSKNLFKETVNFIINHYKYN